MKFITYRCLHCGSLKLGTEFRLTATRSKCKKCEAVTTKQKKLGTFRKLTWITKHCSKCGSLQLENYFAFRAKGTRGGICIFCNRDLDNIKKRNMTREQKDRNNSLYRSRRRANPIKYREKEVAQYRKNVEKRKLQAREFRRKNKERVRAKAILYGNSPSKSKHYSKVLPITDEPKMERGFLTVVCKKCGVRFSPTNNACVNRMGAFRGNLSPGGENNFYCSDACKETCSIYRAQALPRDMISESQSQKVRACQTKSLKELQCDEVGHNYCEKCGDIIVDPYLHHTLPVAQYKEEAINGAGHMILCFRCHNEPGLHQNC